MNNNLITKRWPEFKSANNSNEADNLAFFHLHYFQGFLE